MKLNERAVIALFDSGQWRTVKRHAAETRAENARHGLKNEAKVDVKICSHPALEMIQSIISSARAEHYRLCPPTGQQGMRFCPGALQIEHAAAMADFAAKFRYLVAEFCSAYEGERLSAPARLNGLYVESQWPDVETVRSEFRFSTRYLPMGSGGQWDEWLAEAATEAQNDLRARLAVAIKAVAVRLADTKGIFRDSLIVNLKELLALAPDLNLRDDPEITRLVAAAADVVKEEPDTLREDKPVRAKVAQRAADLCSMFKL